MFYDADDGGFMCYHLMGGGSVFMCGFTVAVPTDEQLGAAVLRNV